MYVPVIMLHCMILTTGGKTTHIATLMKNKVCACVCVCVCVCVCA